jgi:hypothetical protein
LIYFLFENRHSYFRQTFLVRQNGSGNNQETENYCPVL